MITTHQYLDSYPIRKESTRLILGTIHPHNHEKFLVPFFYGNRLSIWKILNDAFEGEIELPISVDGILRFLHNHNISISDTVRKCRRTSTSSLDEDFEPLEFNLGLLEDIRQSQINEILFTSGFATNNAFYLFYKKLLGLSIPNEVRKNRTMILDQKYLGRPIKLTVLYSPSGTANRGIANSNKYKEKRHLYSDERRPVQKFKVDYYREMFS